MHTVVVFHRDERDRVDEALRELSAEGIDRDHLLLAPTGEPPPEQAPRALFGLPHHVHYGGIGAAIGMIVGLAFRPGEGALWGIWMVITGAVLFGMFGAAVGVVVGGIRRQRWRMRTPHPDLAVRVEAESHELVERAREILLAHGGVAHDIGHRGLVEHAVEGSVAEGGVAEAGTRETPAHGGAARGGGAPQPA